MSSYRVLRLAGLAIVLLLSACESSTAVRLAPYDLKIVSGNDQEVRVGSPLAPLVVEVVDIEGNPVPGAPVAWEVATGDVRIAARSSVANSSGLAQMSAILGPTPGLSVVAASLPTESISVYFNFQGTP